MSLLIVEYSAIKSYEAHFFFMLNSHQGYVKVWYWIFGRICTVLKFEYNSEDTSYINIAPKVVSCFNEIETWETIQQEMNLSSKYFIFLIYIYIYIYICGVCVCVCVCKFSKQVNRKIFWLERWLRRWHSASGKYTRPTRIPATLPGISSCRHRPPRPTHTRLNACALIKEAKSPHKTVVLWN